MSHQVRSVVQFAAVCCITHDILIKFQSERQGKQLQYLTPLLTVKTFYLQILALRDLLEDLQFLCL